MIATLIFVAFGTLSLAGAGYLYAAGELRQWLGVPLATALVVIAIMNFAAAELAYRFYQAADYAKKVHEESEYISELLEDIRNTLRPRGTSPKPDAETES